MKKLHLLPLLALMMLIALCTTASAVYIAGQVPIAAVYDGNQQVTELTDDSTATTWTQRSTYGVDLTIHLYGSTVGEIWMRNGHCYSQNYYTHYDRPEVVRVTVYYQANQYTVSSDTYRFRMSDAYRPSTVSAGWNSGYQRMLLPKAYQRVTKIELTIESSRTGLGGSGQTIISDIVVASGSHATATPRNHATATPRVPVVYVTPTPAPYSPNTSNPYWEYITPQPTRTSQVQYITPQPTRTSQVQYITPQPTNTPLVEYITPRPTAAVPDFPSNFGAIATLNKRIAARTGPANRYDEPGTFLGDGDYVNVIGKVWDDNNDLWWYQLEFYGDGDWYRAYTTGYRVNIDPDIIPTEYNMDSPREVLRDHRVYYGPGEEYRMYRVSMLYEGSRAVLIQVEGSWAQIEYVDYAVDDGILRRGWVPLDVLSDYPYAW